MNVFTYGGVAKTHNCLRIASQHMILRLYQATIIHVQSAVLRSGHTMNATKIKPSVCKPDAQHTPRTFPPSRAARKTRFSQKQRRPRRDCAALSSRYRDEQSPTSACGASARNPVFRRSLSTPCTREHSTGRQYCRETCVDRWAEKSAGATHNKTRWERVVGAPS